MIRSTFVVSVALAASALVAFLPVFAQAGSPVFTAFASVCGQPAADFPAVRAAADGHGWGATDVTADANMPGVTIADKMTRAFTADKTGLVLSAWRGTKGDVKISDCTVHVAKADFDSLKGEASAWLAFPAQDSTPKHATFRFTDAGGGHKALTSADFDAAAGGAGLEILTVSGDQNGTVLDLMMIKK